VTEKFQPRELTSFSVHQLEGLVMWSAKSGVLEKRKEGLSLFEAFNLVLGVTNTDESGKLLDEKGRERLRLGFTAVGRILAREGSFSNIQGPVSVWQTTPDADQIEVRWAVPDTRLDPNLGKRLFQRQASSNY
jgi:hypothetical protein